MQIPVLRPLLLPLVLLALVVGACQPTAAAMPRLDDPKEILEEALRTTAELDWIHARVEATAEGGIVGGDELAASLEGDLDLDKRDFHAVIEGPEVLGGIDGAELLLVGTEMFTRFDGAASPSGEKWTRTTLGADNDPRSGIPPTPAIAVALKSILDDPSVSASLVGMEPCGAAQCYHVALTVAPELIGRAMSGDLFAPNGSDGGPVDGSIPEVVLDVQVEEATRRLMSVATSVTYAGTTVDVRATFTKHDVQVDLLEPRENEVQDSPEGGPDILEQVDGLVPD